MIKLTTDCGKCVHANVCKYRGCAESAMKKLKDTMYTPGRGGYDWETESNYYHYDITFSCPMFTETRTNRETKLKDFIKENSFG